MAINGTKISTTTTHLVTSPQLEELFRDVFKLSKESKVSISPRTRIIGYGMGEHEVFDGLSVTITDDF